jgi:CTP:molybdopterin cytidylyltransferase MocA
VGYRPTVSRVSGVVLAAGAGRRMGTPKADLVVDGRRLVDRAVAVMAHGGCDEIVVVIRAGTGPVDGARVVVNPDPERGMRSSLVAGLDVATGDAMAVMLVDTPGIEAEAVAAVLDRWRANPERIVVADFDGRRGHPIVMAAEKWRAAVAMAGADEGARRYLAANADMVDDLDVSGDPTDLDRPEDLQAWRARRYI